ncbi:MAG TPA: hypothetical protein VM123_15895 [archaeon]|nr:hypothetical protein [archaeon]
MSTILYFRHGFRRWNAGGPLRRLKGALQASIRHGKLPAVLIFLLWSLVPLEAQVYFKAGEEGFRFGNGYLERCFALEGEVWRTAWLVNKQTGHTWRADSDEFRIRFTYERLGYWPGLENPMIIGAKDCIFRGYSLEKPQGGSHRLVLDYHWEQGLSGAGHSADWDSPGLEIEVSYSLTDTLPYMHKEIRLSCQGGKYYFVEELALENMSLAGARTLHQGFGQPVYTEELFFGLEYPAGNNLMQEGDLELYYYPGKLIGPSGYESYSAVWGVAPEGRTRAAFLKYVDRIRVAPARPFLLYNSWYDLRTAERAEGEKGGILNYENCLKCIQSFKENLVDHGIKLESFVLDEGWDKYTPFWEVNTRNFPGGLGRLTKSLEGIGSALGLWLGPIGGYGEGLRLRSEAGRKAGLEVSRKGYLDHAGPKYNKVLTDRLLEYVRQYGVNYYKFDGLIYGYGDTDHGMLPGIYSREAHTAALAALLDTLHAVRPGIYTNITTSQWLSPWWLAHADCVFMGGADYGWLKSLPALSKRDQAISYRDKVCFDQFRDFNQQFPMNSIMTVGVIKGEYQLLGEPDETLDKWTNNLVMHFSRGLAMWELYLSPQILKEDEWESLRASIHWATANSGILLSNSTMVGGNPAEREPYGYFHCGAQKMILTVRNPYIKPVTFRMRLDYENGWLQPGNEAYLPLVVYPYRAVEGPWLSYGEMIEVPLSGYETKVIELLRRERVGFPILQGVAFGFTDQGLVIYPEENTEKVTIENSTAGELNVSGKPVPPGVEIELPLESTGEAGRLELEDRREGEWKSGGFDRPAGELSLSLPDKTVSAEIAFLLELESGLQGLEPRITDNGSPLACRTESDERGNWYWFVARLEPQVPHRIAYNFNIQGPPVGSGTLSAWLIALGERKGYDINVSGAQEMLKSLDQEHSLPSRSDIRRRVECLFERPVRF